MTMALADIGLRLPRAGREGHVDTAPPARPAVVTGAGHGPAGAPRKEYRRGIDLLRLVAAIGIVADHTMGWFVVGYPALGVFLILTSYFSVGSYLRSGGQGFWAARAWRMALPWLFWCAVYRVAWEVVYAPEFRLLTDPFSLFVGPFVHLWFLPFAMIALLLIPAIAREVTTVAALRVACALLLVGSVALGLVHAKAGIVGWMFPDTAIPQPVPQWAFSLPIYLWGALAAVAHRLGQARLTLATAFLSSAILLALEWDMASYQLALSALIFEAVWRLRGRAPWMTAAAGAAFGIYLLHPAFALVGYKLIGAEAAPGAIFAVALAGAWGATLLLKRLPVLRAVV